MLPNLSVSRIWQTDQHQLGPEEEQNLYIKINVALFFLRLDAGRDQFLSVTLASFANNRSRMNVFLMAFFCQSFLAHFRHLAVSLIYPLDLLPLGLNLHDRLKDHTGKDTRVNASISN